MIVNEMAKFGSRPSSGRAPGRSQACAVAVGRPGIRNVRRPLPCSSAAFLSPGTGYLPVSVQVVSSTDRCASGVVERFHGNFAGDRASEDLDFDSFARLDRVPGQVRVRDRAPDRVTESAARHAAGDLAVHEHGPDRVRSNADPRAADRRASARAGRPWRRLASRPMNSPLSSLTANPRPAS